MKKLLTILVLIMLIISFFQITSMYALYKEQMNGDYSSLLGAWEIRVNGTDITTSGQIETFTITDNQLGYVTSEYIQAGKIAPSGQAYFDIVIDPSNIYIDEDTQTETTVYNDVSIIYKIDIDKKATSSINSGIELADAIELVSGENYFGQGTDGQTNKTANTVSNIDGNTYTSVIPVDKITQGYKNYIRLYLKWKNVTTTIIVDDVETTIETNNELDTTLGETQESVISIPLQINLKQYTGEVIGNGTE